MYFENLFFRYQVVYYWELSKWFGVNEKKNVENEYWE